MSIRVLLSATLLTLFGAPLLADAQPWNVWTNAGYRSVGLDMDDDDDPGNSAEDLAVCDDTTTTDETAGYSTETILGSARQVFIVGTSPPTGWTTGTDDANCGELGDECRTLAQAQTNNTAAETIFCVAGFLNEELDLPNDGAAGTRTITASDPYYYDRVRATDPSMVVGIDADGDNSYPPFDTDDSAIFDGTGQNNFAWQFDSTDVGDRIEVAHLSFTDWGDESRDSGGFIDQEFAGAISHHYVHDVHVDGVNETQCHGSGAILISMFGSNRSHFEFAYSTVDRLNGYTIRGGIQAAGNTLAYLDINSEYGGRATNVNGAGSTCGNTDGNGGTNIRIWGLMLGDYDIQMVGNDMTFTDWTTAGGEANGHKHAFGLSLCAVRGFAFRGNRVQNWVGGLPGSTVEDNICDGAGGEQFSGDWRFHRNVYTADASVFETPGGHFLNALTHGDDTTGRETTINGTTGVLEVLHNEIDFQDFGDYDRVGALMVWQQANDGDHNGLTVTISNNDVRGCTARNVGVLWWQFGTDVAASVPGSLEIDNNTTWYTGSCGDAGKQTEMDEVPSTFSADGNSLSNCNVNFNNVQYSSAAAINALSEWSNTTCSNTVGTLGDYATISGGPTPSPTSEVFMFFPSSK